MLKIATLCSAIVLLTVLLIVYISLQYYSWAALWL